VEIFFNLPIKSVQSDGGGEFIPLQRYFNSMGINYRQTCLHTHHQNGGSRSPTIVRKLLGDFFEILALYFDPKVINLPPVLFNIK
jgi:hypothetical protein